jgi:hypothetical protein
LVVSTCAGTEPALASSRSKILDWAEAPLFHVRNRLLPAIENTAYQIKEKNNAAKPSNLSKKKKIWFGLGLGVYS